MSDLFRVSNRWDALKLPDADISYMSCAELGRPDVEVLRILIADTPWRSEMITVWGKTYRQPRLSAWYGDNTARYTYSGIRLEPLPWNELLSELKRRIETLTGKCFNSVLLNYYRNEADSMGAHADDEPELGPAPNIASLSLGETRTLVLKHRQRSDIKPVRLALSSGSILLMQGDTQRHWKHSVGKLTKPCGPRVNLTFRLIYPCGVAASR